MAEKESEMAQGLAQSFKALIDEKPWELDVPQAQTVAAPETTAPESPPALLRLVEALLFVGGVPLTPERAAAVIRGLTGPQFAQAIASLNQNYRRQGRPYFIEAQGQGFSLILRPRFRPVVERLYGQAREARLSPPAIDVLALVAYLQPVTKQEID